jgi:hypothetical protein
MGKFWNVLLGFITVISFLICFAWVELMFIYTPPEVVNTVYANKITMPDGQIKNFLELNRFESVAGSGLPAYELRINAYTDHDLQYAMGFGMQWVDLNKDGNFGVRKTNINDESDTAKIEWDIDTVNGVKEITYYQTNSFNNSVEPVEKIEVGDKGTEFYFTTGENNDNVFMARFNGKQWVAWAETTAGSVIGGVWDSVTYPVVAGLRGLFGFSTPTPDFQEHHSQQVDCPIEDFFLATMALTHSSQGYGDYEVEAFTIDKYTDLKILKDGQFAPLSQSDNSTGSAYFSASVHTDKRGLASASQSLFLMVNGDAEYNYGGTASDNEFWQYKVNYNLTINDFDIVGDMLLLKQPIYDNLREYDNLNISVSLNLDDTDIVGFAPYCFFGLELNTISLTATTAREFILSAYSLWDTDLAVWNCSPIISVEIDENAINKGGVI